MAEYDFIPLKVQTSAAWLGAGAGKPGTFATVLKGTADFLVEQKSIRSTPDAEAFQKARNTKFLTTALG